jgi:hypothetical protein
MDSGLVASRRGCKGDLRGAVNTEGLLQLILQRMKRDRSRASVRYLMYEASSVGWQNTRPKALLEQRARHVGY